MLMDLPLYIMFYESFVCFGILISDSHLNPSSSSHIYANSVN